MKRRLIVGTTAAIAMTAVAIAGTGSYVSQSFAQSPPSSGSVTQNSPKELVDEVWQIVERQYIDTTFNGKDWRAVRQQYLNRSYASQEEAFDILTAVERR
jgi:carboxyl-terminal processing protease